MKRYELNIGSATHFLTSRNETDARKEAEDIVTHEKTPDRQRYWSRGEFCVDAHLREVNDLETYQIYTPTI